jgi:hypothetical protein
MQCGAVSVRPAVLPYELARSAILKSVKIAGSNRNHGRKYTTEASNMVSLVLTWAKRLAADTTRQTLLMGPKVL